MPVNVISFKMFLQVFLFATIYFSSFCCLYPNFFDVSLPANSRYFFFFSLKNWCGSKSLDSILIMLCTASQHFCDAGCTCNTLILHYYISSVTKAWRQLYFPNTGKKKHVDLKHKVTWPLFQDITASLHIYPVTFIVDISLTFH